VSRARVLPEITSIFDLEALARARLPRVIFDYVHGGSYEQVTRARNRDDLRALALRPHVLRNVSHPRTEVTMAGERAAIPVAIAPTGLAGLTWANGECEAALAARDFGIPFCLSTMSICSIEDVAQATGTPFWFQLYLMKSREVNESLVARARAAGCSALVLTLDRHVQGKRWADAKNGLSVPPKVTLANSLDVVAHLRWLFGMARSKRWTFGNLQGEVQQAKHLSVLTQWVEAQFDPSFDARSVSAVRRQWPRKLILKGILHVDDARAAIDLGADAIVVSNHGGRQLEGAPSTIRALPQIADAVVGKIEVFFDGGIRTGADIVKAMGRGANACLTGRGYLYGLAAKGYDGVTCALQLLRDELLDTLVLAGLDDVRAIPEGVVTAQPAL